MSSKIAFIGAGNIATAIVSGSINSGYIKPSQIYMYDICEDKLKKFTKYGVNTSLDIIEIVSKCDYIFLTVKPQIYEEVLLSIKNSISSEKCIISVAAGISIDYVKKCIGYDCKVIRVMPNTPLMCCKGASALVNTAPVTKDNFDFIKGIFDTCGKTAVVQEELMDTITGVSGSSPAFIFRFIRNLINTGVDNGLDYETSKKMVLATIVGSAEMISVSDESIDNLIKNVASPNGTTEAGLKFLDNNNFDYIVENSVKAAIERSKELKK